MPGTGTGLIIIDMIIRPFLKFGMKFPLIGFSILFMVYGFIAYQALKTAFMSERL